MDTDYDKAKLQAQSEIVIDSLVEQIKTAFARLLDLYGVFTYKITGKRYSIYNEGLLNYKTILTFDKLQIKVKPHGYGKACFLIYKKGWFSKKVFYHCCGYDFHTEYDRNTRYNFTVEDYTIILNDLKKTIEKLKE